MKLKQLISIIAPVALAGILVSSPAQAVEIVLAEWAVNIDGVVSDPTLGDPIPVGVDVSLFDQVTGLGSISVTISGAGVHAFDAFFDNEIDEAINTFFNESGAANGTVAAGQSWEIDEPGFVFGDIFDNFLTSTLDNSNAVPAGLEDDVSMAMGWDLTLVAGEQATIGILLSQSMPVGGFFLTHTDPDSGESIYLSSTLSIYQIGLCGDPATYIHTVQGSGPVSPLAGSTGVIIEGVVIGDFENASTELGGFFLQEEDVDTDSDLQTSEGIFVFNNGLGHDVSVGDVIRVRGDVAEYYGLTELTNVTNLVVCSAGSSVTAATVTLPLGAVEDLERNEGMLINIPQTLYVADNYNLGRYGEVDLSVGARPDIPTNVVTPGAPALDLADLNARSRIQLDDGSTIQDPLPLPPYLGDVNTLRAGDTTPSLTGVLGYSFGRYEVHPTGPVDFTRVNTRDTAPPDVGGTLKVASFNVLNYFSTIDTGPDICGPSANMACRGADTTAELARQRDKLINAIVTLDADIIGLMELENNAIVAIQDLVDGLNLVAGSGTYSFIDTGAIGADAIKVAFIYQPAAATPIGSFAVLDALVDPAFLDTKNRPSLAQTFEGNATGEKVTVAVNHFKSKGSPCNDVADPDLDDGQGNCNLTRTTAATALVNWLATDPTASGDPDYLIIGDLNAYAKEDPINAIKAAGYNDLIEDYEGSGAYSYVFFGEAGYLDHALANTSLAPKVSGLGIWHINADEPSALDYNDYNQPGLYNPGPYRSSDHDPVLIGLSPDDDNDGLPDGSDPDTAAEAVTELPDGVFDNNGDPQGQRNAILSRLDDIEQEIKDGDIAGALRMLRNLRRKLDGCPDVATAGEMADKNDWIADCDAQRDIRAIIDLLITNLSS